MPALRQPEIVSTDRDLGPNVPTIFVIAEKKLCINTNTKSIIILIKSIIKK
jgi:hypothetical protein